MKTVKLVITLLVCSLPVLSQPRTSPSDTSADKQEVILKKLAEIEQRQRDDSIQAASSKALQEHIKYITEDGRQHREFIMGVYNYTFAVAGIIMTLFIGLLSFLGYSAYRNGVKMIEGILEKKLVEKAGELLSNKERDVDELIQKKTKEIDARFAAMANINSEQDKKLDDLIDDVLEIKKNIQIQKRESILEYAKDDGSELILETRQQFVCISDKYPITKTYDYVYVGEGGRVEFVDGTHSELARAVPNNIAGHKCDINTTLLRHLRKGDPPFFTFVKVRLIGAFLELH